jgi:hypothetical protein
VCDTALDRELDLHYGQRLMATGRLRIERRPASGLVTVFSRLELPGARWEPVATVEADKAGRFRYAIEPGPARRIRFRCAGTELTEA